MKEEKNNKYIFEKNEEGLTEELEGDKSYKPSEPSAHDADIPSHVVKAVDQGLEKRISLETLFSQKFSDLRSHSEKDINSHFREVKIYGTFGLIILALLGVIGFKYMLDNTTQQINKKLVEPEINKAAKDFVATKIQPLEKRVEQLNDDIRAKQAELANAQTQLRQMQEIQQFSVGARAGSRADYEKLLELSKSEDGNIRRNAEVAIRDLAYYFSADRHQLSGYYILLDGKSFKEVYYSVEELASTLEDDNPIIRESTVNVIADTGKKYFVEDLVRTLSKEPNLRICARITRALENITDSRFDPLAFDAVASWWEQNKENKEYLSPFHYYFDGITAMSSGSKDEALINFDRMIKKEPQALFSMFYKAQIFTQSGKYDRAEKTLKKVEEVNNNFRWLYVGYAYFFIKQGKQDKAIVNINRALEISPGIEESIRSQPWVQPLLDSKAIKWSSHHNEMNQEKIKKY